MSAFIRSLLVIALGVGLASPSGVAEEAGTARSQPAVGPCFPPGQAPSVDGPSPRRGMGMANDAARKQVVLFGGYDGATNFADTWTWDGAAWTEQHPADSPSARRSFGMAYDAARRQIVLFGGSDGVNEFGDTWIWDGADWIEQHPAISPSPRALVSMAFHAGTRTIVLHGGVPGEYYTSWLWDGSDWEEVHHGAPRDRLNEGMTRDGNNVTMFGGERDDFEWYVLTWTTFTWDGTQWHLRRTPTKPSARKNVAMAYDVARSESIMFGGVDGEGLVNDTWAWDGHAWTKLHPADSPAERQRTAIAYDSAREQVVLFGGTQILDECFFGDTWTWDGVTWTEH
jgi:hypothetical protein